MSSRASGPWIVVFDDGRFLGIGRPVLEYPDARLFNTRAKAEREARAVNLPSTIISTREYQEQP